MRPGARNSLRRPRRVPRSHYRLLPALQLANRQRCARFLSDLVVASPFPPHTSEFSLQVHDLTHVWSHSDSVVVELDDILALAAAVHVFIKLNLSPQQRYPRTLSELFAAVAELFTWQPDDVPVLHNASTQHITHIEFRFLEQQEFKLALLMPMAWLDIFSRRLSLRQQQQRQPHRALHSESLAAFTNHVAAAHVQYVPFRSLSAASQIRAAAWFVSALLWLYLSLVPVPWRNWDNASKYGPYCELFS